ncbi:hypothetical protein AXG93_2931s1730 [Marchantia polymorpha subsp. ruderalis]|uniref:Uncharacterized protein n=1 Tax=Marchantia polymorpha subsp. ruderalis TaxID=1480154 RepID=A0A176VVU0_MARPO|nr:hypothetical protein AXG93_2931s1730 [Marchantia polymorpha subsp. ruderalis]
MIAHGFKAVGEAGDGLLRDAVVLGIEARGHFLGCRQEDGVFRAHAARRRAFAPGGTGTMARADSREDLESARLKPR